MKSLKSTDPNINTIGTVMVWFADQIPEKWTRLNGQELNKNSYPELFDLFGYKYGGYGDYFNLPKLEGSPYMLDNSDTRFNTLNSKYGEKTHKLTIEEMARHNHNSLWHGYRNINPEESENSQNRFIITQDPPTAQQEPITTKFLSYNTGGDQEHNTLHPITVCDYIIYTGHDVDPSTDRGYITIRTQRYDGSAINGGRYKLINSQNRVVGEYVVEKNGFINITDLKSGIYTVSEVMPPVGFLKCKKTETIVINNDNHEVVFVSVKIFDTIPEKVPLLFYNKEDETTEPEVKTYPYNGVRIGEHYWMDENFNIELPRVESLCGQYNAEPPVNQEQIDTYLPCIEMPKSEYPVDVNDFQKYYGMFYHPWSKDYINDYGQMLENGNFKDSKWGIPSNKDFDQLFAMCPFYDSTPSKNHINLNERDIRFTISADEGSNPLAKNRFIDDKHKIYWFMNRNNDERFNMYGFNLMPGGKRQNGDVKWENDFGWHQGKHLDLNYTFYTAWFWIKESKLHLRLHDWVDSEAEESFHRFNLRWCRRLTDEELGYKLYIKINSLSIDSEEWQALKNGNEYPLLRKVRAGDISFNNVTIEKHNLLDVIPEGFIELPKGYIRGFYVQYILNNNSPLSVPAIINYAANVEDTSVGYIPPKS